MTRVGRKYYFYDVVIAGSKIKKVIYAANIKTCKSMAHKFGDPVEIYHQGRLLWSKNWRLS